MKRSTKDTYRTGQKVSKFHKIAVRCLFFFVRCVKFMWTKRNIQLNFLQSLEVTLQQSQRIKMRFDRECVQKQTLIIWWQTRSEKTIQLWLMFLLRNEIKLNKATKRRHDEKMRRWEDGKTERQLKRWRQRNTHFHCATVDEHCNMANIYLLE